MRAPIGTSHANLVEREKGEGGGRITGRRRRSGRFLGDEEGVLRRRTVSARMEKTSGVQTSFASLSDDSACSAGLELPEQINDDPELASGSDDGEDDGAFSLQPRREDEC